LVLYWTPQFGHEQYNTKQIYVNNTESIFL